MALNRTNILLSGLLVLVALLTAATRVNYSQPNFEILPDMKYTPAWQSYAPNPVFATGRTLQAPPPGTIARGRMPLHFAATKEDAVRAGEELQNPDVQAGSEPARLQESLARGDDIYRVFCTSCHGAAGAGDGPVPQRGFPPPPSLLTGKSPHMQDGQLFHILTYGQGNMSDFAAQLSPQSRWDVINYIRQLQAQPAAAGAENSVGNTQGANQPTAAGATETADPQPENDKK